MLTIKRVATVLSNYQEDNKSDNSLATRYNIQDKDKDKHLQLPLIEVPLYVFSKTKVEEVEGNVDIPCNEEGYPISLLNNLLLKEWKERMCRGLFRYDVSTCETKVINPESSGFIVQLNEGRHLKKRPTEFRIDQVLQPFDKNKFNFTKIGLEEVLFRFQPSNITTGNADDNISPNIVAINVSPIEYGHVLLIPRVNDCLPQIIDCESLSLALYFAKEADDPFFRVGYNSLGAFATINHLHFQAYYLSLPFPVEKALYNRIMVRQEGLDGTKLIVSELLGYPVHGLVFEGGSSLDDLADAVSNSCLCLQKHNIPFNVLIADCGQKVYLFPQCYAEKQALGEVSQELLDTQVNPAVWEISGHIVLKRKEDYDDASEEQAWKLLSRVSLSEEKFEELKACICDAAEFKQMCR